MCESIVWMNAAIPAGFLSLLWWWLVNASCNFILFLFFLIEEGNFILTVQFSTCWYRLTDFSGSIVYLHICKIRIQLFICKLANPIYSCWFCYLQNFKLKFQIKKKTWTLIMWILVLWNGGMKWSFVDKSHSVINTVISAV